MRIASLINLALSERKSEKGFKTHNADLAITRDHSMVAGAATMLTGLAWEGYSLLVGNYQGFKSTHYDWADVSMYGVGVLALMAVAKLAHHVNGEPVLSIDNERSPKPQPEKSF